MSKNAPKSFRRHSTALAAVLLLSASFATTAMAEDRTYVFNIPAEDTAKALNDFAKQADVEIMFPYAVAAKHKAPAISGTYTREEVLKRLLEGTGLEVAEQTATSVTLREAQKTATQPTGSVDEPVEIVVTGTHIRGGNPTSPVRTVGRKEIEQSGYSQTGDLIRSLPENFNGGQNPGVSFTGGDLNNQNITNASTVNLRGLGSDATLVLLNGHRLGGDAFFQGADVSVIPLPLIQRVEIVPDGASALYGADAVAGVVNFVLRRDFEGGEIRARTGMSTEGGGDERGISGVTGITGQKSYLTLAVDYSEQDPLRAGDRRALSNMAAINTLLRGQEKVNAFVSAGHDFGSGGRLSLDVLFNERKSTSTSRFSPTSLLSAGSQRTPSLNAALSWDVSLSSDWKLKISATGSGSRNSYSVLYPAYNLTTRTIYKNRLAAFEATADGRLFSLPSGDVMAAFGGGYREERFQQGFSGPSRVVADRQVQYAFGEATIPLISPSNERTGLNELTIDTSLRAESYNDIGTSANPKLGIRYVPYPALSMRATWGKSFKAPSLLQLYSAKTVTLYSASEFGGPSASTVLYSHGGNDALKPEKSNSWTVGFDYAPNGTKGLNLSATVFDVEYTDRVVTPVPDYTSSLSDAQYAPFFDFLPSAALQSTVMASADVFYNDVGTYDPSNVVAILNNHYTNATAQNANGFDLSIRDTFSLTKGDISVFVNGTWLTLRQQTIPTQPDRTLSGRIYYPAKFRGRGGVSWQAGGLSATGFVNYLAPELDTGVTPAAEIGSWTTIDATVSYKFTSQHWSMSGVKVSLSVINLLDQMPPRIYSPAATLPHVDLTNTSILGRYLSLTISKAW